MSGYDKPNYTQAPNAFFDKTLLEIDTVTELKVTLVIIRQTLGFHKDEDELSLTRLQQLTGLRREGCVDGLKRAMARGTITRRKVKNSYAYRLQIVGKPDHLQDTDSRQTGPEVVGKPDHLLVGKPDPQKKVRKKPLKKGAKAPTTIYSKVIQDCLATLDSLEGYPKNKRQNAEHLEKQCERHPGLDIRREIEKFRNHYEEQGFDKKQRPRARLSTWLDNAEDWSRNSYAEPVRSSVAGYRRFD